MSTIETIEYFDNCPNCGAVHDGSGACSYCGTSLIRERRVTALSESAEDAMLREDAGLPVIKGRNGKVSPFLLLFCPIFGGSFLVIPLIVFTAFASTGIMRPWVFIMLTMFALIGVVGLAPLVTALLAKRKCQRGQRIVGTVRGYRDNNYSINGRPAQIIRIRFDGTEPCILELGTGGTDRPYAPGTRVTLLNGEGCYLIEGVERPDGSQVGGPRVHGDGPQGSGGPQPR